MNSISEKEIFRRLQLVRDTRLAYVKKYGLSDEEVRFRYDLLKRLDETEYIKVEITNLRCVKYGKYEHTKVVTNFDPIKDALEQTKESFMGRAKVDIKVNDDNLYVVTLKGVTR